MFKDIFGNSPQTKILDFLADHPNYDYNVSDISKNSDVSRPTVYKIIEILLKKKLIVKTRESGNSSLYKLNMENKLVQVILKFDFELAGPSVTKIYDVAAFALEEARTGSYFLTEDFDSISAICPANSKSNFNIT
jgi:DNA-binding transcriptional ArsR family regulator